MAMVSLTYWHRPIKLIVDRNPRKTGGNCPQSLLPSGRVTSAVPPAPREQAAAAGRIIECENTPMGGAVTRDHGRRDSCGT
jgi:hypothetical protein